MRAANCGKNGPLLLSVEVYLLLESSETSSFRRLNEYSRARSADSALRPGWGPGNVNAFGDYRGMLVHWQASRVYRGLSLMLALQLTACASASLESLTGGPSEIDRTFLLAAGNWDRNKDGNVTCDEWKAYAAELFAIGDVERKGYLTPQDWKRIVDVDRMFETVNFKYYDRNGDGKVDRAEFIDRPNRAFELADANKDCTLTTVELTAARTAGAPAPKVVPAGSESGSKGSGGGPGGMGR